MDNFEGSLDLGRMANNIFVFDLDGTLVFDDMTISPLLVEQLLRLNKSNQIIFASARPVRDMLPLLSTFPNNDLIGGNGSIIRHNGRVMTTNKIDAQLVREILDFISKYQLDYVVDYDWDYSAHVADDNAIMSKLDIKQQANNVPLSTENVIKIIIFNVTEELFNNLNLSDELAVLYHADVEEVVITAQGINRYQTLKGMIGNKEYIAFGNDINDYEMLANANVPVVLGNDSDILQQGMVHLQANDKELISFLSQFN